MKKIIASLLLLGFAYNATAQNALKTPMHFQSILQAGLLAGKTEPSFGVQTINGVRWKQISAGIGAGIDNYVFRTIPVFIDLRADILKSKNSPFVFADAGPQFQWVQDHQKAGSFFNPEYKSGFYFNAGAGYSIYLFKRNTLTLSAAFSLKKVNESLYTYCDFVACPEQKPTINKYTFRRLAVMAGWTIW
ncbi:hypothetical protein [Parafilimonas terrae]|jgi:hypothetical protein|uniref:Outer membrane protein beta-barrel domain-containing protein n=1 Tax=Parafilimonas terrae TaxID=1465490 RepID=A0A1I5SAP8_9BACT|nr:hypothetical protein [Parafilimonas terrae]SFP67858.1 hypothetical protein SAMN05444277_101675 [Parafilimonas terrae]